MKINLLNRHQKILLHWCLWFFLGNTLLFWFIGLNYLSSISWLDTDYLNAHGKLVVKVFSALGFAGHFSLLAMLPCVALVPLILIFPKRRFIFSVCIASATLMNVMLVIDVVTYQLFRFHLNGVILNLILHGLGSELFGLSWKECLYAAGIVSGIFLLEYAYARELWRWMDKYFFQYYLKWIVAVLGVCLYMSYCMLIYNSGIIFGRVLVDVSRFMPLYPEIFGAILPIKNGKDNMDALAQRYLIQPKKMNAPLNYPLQPLQFSPSSHPKNLVIIVIDTWRFDMLNREVSPTLMDFSKHALVFNNHFSGGNSTGPGIFSLFYGLPISYWTAMQDQQQGPVLIKELIKRHYQMGIFGSAPLRLPPFDKTVFNDVKGLQVSTKGATPYQRDEQITREFKQFIANATAHTQQPFFSFVFYDGAHSYCAYKEDLKPFAPAIQNCNRMDLDNQHAPLPYLNRYKNAVLLVDQQINQVLSTLKTHHLLDNTVVVVTGDHGEEFNDNHLGYWGHASDYTHFQTQTPLMVYWPGMQPKIYSHQTSHFDVAPTLMQKLLGCTTAPSHYSLGSSLFDTKPRPYLIIGSYIDFAVVNSQQIIHVAPAGNLRIDQLNGRPDPQAKLNIVTMQKAFEDMRRFYKSNTPKSPSL